MYNGSEKEKIDIDELVDFLVKRKDGVEEPERPTPEERDIFAHLEDPADVLLTEEEPITEQEPEPVFEKDQELKPEMILEFETPSEAETVAEEREPVLEMPEKEVVSIQEEISDGVTPEGTPFPMFEQAEEQPKKKKRWFGRRSKEETPIEETWADWGLTPLGQRENEGEAGRITAAEINADLVTEEEDSNGFDEFPAVAAVAETITMQVVLPSGVAVPRPESATRVIPTIPEEALVEDVRSEPETPPVPQAPPVEEVHEEQLPDQLSLEEMVRVEDIEPTEELEEVVLTESPEEMLQRNRMEKVREFTLDGEEEEENEPEQEYIQQPEEEELSEEYTDQEDAAMVAEELQYRTRFSLLSFLITGLVELVLLLLVVLTELADVFLIPFSGYLAVQALALVAMLALNYRSIGRGFSGLFMLQANCDTAPALVGTMALFDVLLRFADADQVRPYWAPLAGLLLAFCAAGRYLHALSVRRNFAFVAYRGDKYAATLIEEENAVQEIGRRAAGTGEATVGYFHRTGFLSDYLTNTREPHQGDDWSRWMTPVALGISLILSFLSLNGPLEGFYGWLTAFTGLLCMTMPVTHLAVQLSLNHCGRVMLSRGGFLVGWKAVRQFGQLDALVVDMADLYPDESMLLHGIKTFSGTHIDEAILSAAALTVRSGGPLSMIFRRIIENKEELLPEVDTLVYEQGMGLSGWVDGRRVFVGNSRLLQNHGVDVPSADYEARYAKNGRQLVYLSVAGQLSAMFVVSYLPDPEIQEALQDLCRSHVTLLVRSCDPNIGTLELCESFGLDEYYVDVLPASAGRAYQQLAERASESMPAVLASNGHILGTAWALSVCRSLRVKSLIALVVQLLSAGLGLVLFMTWAMGNSLSVFLPLVFLLLTSAATWVAPLFKRT